MPILQTTIHFVFRWYFMFLKSKSSVSALTNYSIDLYEAGNYKKAKKICLKLLKKDSTNYTALINLGNIYFIEKNHSSALDAYHQADSHQPNYYPIKINLANTYLEIENYVAAETYAKAALNLDSKSFLAHSILGNSLLGLDRIPEAIEALEKALQLDSKDAWLFNSLSQVYQKNNEISKALQAGWQAVQLSGKDDAQHINFGYLLYEAAMENNLKDAIHFADLWLLGFPENKIALHMGNAIKNSSTIERANDDYLQSIFDVFAKDFDSVLQSLDYQTPEQIFGFLSEIYGKNTHKNLRILDAGCGTGLCGKYLKNYAGFHSLEGVDLSPKMLEVAKQKQIYNKLSCAELGAYLSQHKDAYDLIVSADVFTYFGDLKALFEKLDSSLKKGGRVIFSISENALNNQDYFLHISGRFLHHYEYIVRLAEQQSLLLEKSSRVRLRAEGGQEVWGYIISLLKA